MPLASEMGWPHFPVLVQQVQNHPVSGYNLASAAARPSRDFDEMLPPVFRFSDTTAQRRAISSLLSLMLLADALTATNLVTRST
jgi:hypothetical protein